ncbi:MMPL family transporter [Mycobacterium sp. 1274761.0]|uniref:MMPL family transporter n=1 Tax=Mycobacterium sp. 1274761.0 TaxID=1834077 RepID=UPI001E40C508|nr:MMPL family transporter [Mycobacterium sp. 1274761.0]
MLLTIGITFGSNVSQKLGVAGFIDPDTEAALADDFIDQHFGSTPNLVLQIVATNGGLDDPVAVAAAEKTRRLVETEPTARIIASYTDPSSPELRSRDGQSGVILVHISGSADDASEPANRIITALPVDYSDVTVRAAGSLGVLRQIEDRVSHDLTISEAVALPILFVVLIIVFGGLIAALLPLTIGITSIVLTLLVLLALTTVTDVSIHALTVATAFGLGLSIDFGLLMVSRFREERDNGKDTESAVISTVDTAGRTIVFSAATVTAAMLGLLVFPVYFLRSVGMTAIAVVTLSALSAVVLLPALLTLLGSRIDALPVIRRKTAVSADSMFWRRCAEMVIRRPLWFALPVVAGLLTLGIPFLHVQLATPDERALPTDSNARMLTESMRHDYPVDASQAVTLVTPSDPEALSQLAGPVSQIENVRRVDGPSGTYEHGNRISTTSSASSAPTGSEPNHAFVELSVDAQSDAAQDVVRNIRGLIRDNQIQVGGPTANLIDSRASIAARLPLGIAVMASATFVMLFLFTGSVVVPVKALFLNVLVLAAVLGVMVLIFQDGHLASVLGVTPTPLNLSMVVLLCSIAFSLSVDYEIFLLSRIKEARDSGMSNNDAIVAGLGRVGRIITSAAILLTITLVSFANGLSFMKMFGIGTALAIVIDATVIRGVVVPAFLRVAGEFNWWAPPPLKWLHDRIGLSEAPAAEAIAAPATAPDPPTVTIRSAAGINEKTLPTVRLPHRNSQVEVLPGSHFVANIDGTVIVVAHRETAPLESGSAATRQISTLFDTVRTSDHRRLGEALSVLTATKLDSADFAVLVPRSGALDLYLYGAVTAHFDTGALPGVLHGTPGRLRAYRSLPVPAVATVVTVDEIGQRSAPRRRWTGLYALTAGTVPGQGAVLWATRPTPAAHGVDKDATIRIRRHATGRGPKTGSGGGQRRPRDS